MTEHLKPAGVLIAELKDCALKKNLQHGKLLHMKAILSGCSENIYLSNTLISMYTKCSCTQLAHLVFDAMPVHTAVSWNVLMLGYVDNGEFSLALEAFNSMNSLLLKGKAIHRQASEHGLQNDVVVSTSLVDMYGKCGNMCLAQAVFDRMVQRTVVSWNVLILGYVGNDRLLTALESYTRMDCAPNRVTFVAVIKACIGLAAGREVCMEAGRSVQGKVEAAGLERDEFVSTGLVELYGKYGDMTRATHVFDSIVQRDTVSWNVLLQGYVDNEEFSRALEAFRSMDCAPDSLTFVAVVRACRELREREAGLSAHRRAQELGLENILPVAIALIEMYVAWGDMHGARDVFNRLTNRSAQAWNVLILGYVENGESLTALDVFSQMDCTANPVTYITVLRACGDLGAADVGERIHDRVCELGWDQDERLATCLVDFYGKCGNMNAAEDVFGRMKSRDIVAWTALIGGHRLAGNTDRVFALVKRMHESDVQPSSVTMLLVLTACSHAGMVDEGLKYFQYMKRYGIVPGVKHYSCVVDMLGRANRLDEALGVMRAMPCATNAVTWTGMMGAAGRGWEGGRIVTELVTGEKLLHE